MTYIAFYFLLSPFVVTRRSERGPDLYDPCSDKTDENEPPTKIEATAGVPPRRYEFVSLRPDGHFYAIFERKGRQVKRSLKAKNRELARRPLGARRFCCRAKDAARPSAMLSGYAQVPMPVIFGI
jgi:hypothetical protein